MEHLSVDYVLLYISIFSRVDSLSDYCIILVPLIARLLITFEKKKKTRLFHVRGEKPRGFGFGFGFGIGGFGSGFGFGMGFRSGFGFGGGDACVMNDTLR